MKFSDEEMFKQLYETDKFLIPREQQSFADKLKCKLGFHFETNFDRKTKFSHPRARVGGIDYCYCRRCGYEYSIKWSAF